MGKWQLFSWLKKQGLTGLIALIFALSYNCALSQDGHSQTGTVEEHSDHSDEHSATAEGDGHAQAVPPGHEHCRINDPSVVEEIIHHVAESHDWHITDIPGKKCDLGHTTLTPIALHLPWLFYDSKNGMKFFSSTHTMEEAGYALDHGKVYHAEEMMLEAGARTAIYDVSFTKSALQMLIMALLMILIFVAVAKGYKKNEGKAPKGIQSFFEPVIVFVRDDIGKGYLGKDRYEPFMPYLLTVFFLIWFSNLFGLMPFNSNIAGNTSFTLAMALISFILILFNSTKDFWMHVFWFPGVPVALKPLMLVVEFIGLLTKPIALAIRLFANISAGHFMVLALVGIIFILGENGRNAVAGWGVAPISVAFALFIFCVELIVAVIQAYVFTLLTAVFISQAMETHDDHH